MSRYDIVFHVDRNDKSLTIALRNFMNYAAALKEEQFTAALVVNAEAVALLKKDNTDIGEALERAAAQGLSIRVCNNALVDNGIRPEELYAQCTVIPAGVVELVRLQGEGYAYVKP